MRVLKAYTDIGTLGQHNSNPLPHIPAGARAPRAEIPSPSGDVISISEEARDLMQHGGASGVSVTPQDATYDQRGNIMRQFDTLQGELRALASQFMANSADPAIIGSLRGMQSHISSLRAQV